MSTHPFHHIPTTFLREPEPPDDSENPFVRALAAWDDYVTLHGEVEPRPAAPRLATVTLITRSAESEPSEATATGSEDVKAS